MTAEIVIMNRYALALAADSATTVTRWSKGKREERYFKGSNKIFQVSSVNPVGAMIYSAASMHGVPWEVIFKDFRKDLKKKSFNQLEGYADEFFEFVKTHAHIFSKEVKDKNFSSLIESAAYIYVGRMLDEKDFEAAEKPAERKKAAKKFLDKTEKVLSQQKLRDIFEDDIIDQSVAASADDLSQTMKKQLAGSKFEKAVDFDQLAKIAIESVYKNYSFHCPETGIVFAGYGDHDYFASYAEYKCYGFVGDVLVFEKTKSEEVSYDKVSCIEPFATTSMINTFILGISDDVYGNISGESLKTLEDFGSKLVTATGAKAPTDMKKLISDANKNLSERIAKSAFDAHYEPLRNVIGSLPMDEMAELAETLISLQSLKEKVTKPTESVSGPIDVAMISKGDGFVWVKRKHYFDANLNPRFFTRQQDSTS